MSHLITLPDLTMEERKKSTLLRLIPNGVRSLSSLVELITKTLESLTRNPRLYPLESIPLRCPSDDRLTKKGG